MGDNLALDGSSQKSHDQLIARLRAMPTAEIVIELENLLETMDEFTYNGSIVDAYLSVLDEKDPIDVDDIIKKSIEDLRKLF